MTNTVKFKLKKIKNTYPNSQKKKYNDFCRKI